MVKVKVEVRNMPALREAFKQMPKEVQARAALPATRAAAQVAARAVRAEAPVGTHKGRKFSYKGNNGVRLAGTLKGNIWVKRIKRNLKQHEVGHIVSVHPVAYYYKFVISGSVHNKVPNPFFERGDMASKQAQQETFDRTFDKAIVPVLAKLQKALNK
jgi:HK97 gp10 family phage protein